MNIWKSEAHEHLENLKAMSCFLILPKCCKSQFSHYNSNISSLCKVSCYPRSCALHSGTDVQQASIFLAQFWVCATSYAYLRQPHLLCNPLCKTICSSTLQSLVIPTQVARGIFIFLSERVHGTLNTQNSGTFNTTPCSFEKAKTTVNFVLVKHNFFGTRAKVAVQYSL